MGKYGGHELNITLPWVEIICFPPRSTSKYKPLGLGLIANTKIQYRSILLSATIGVLQRSSEANKNLRLNSGHGKWGLYEGQLHHVGHAIQLFNQSWLSVTRSSAIKCWTKSKFLCNAQVTHLNSLLTSMHRINDVDIDLDGQSIQVSDESGNPLANQLLNASLIAFQGITICLMHQKHLCMGY